MRQILLIAVKAAVSIGLLYFALAKADFSAVGARLNKIDFAWAMFAFVTLALQIVLISFRWRAIAERCGAALALANAFRLNLIATFFNQVLPSTVGGDAVRIWLFARDGAGWAKATHSVLLDRFVGVLALAVLVVISLPWAFGLIQNPIGRTVLLVIGCGSIAGGLAFVALGSRDWAWMQSFWATRQLAQLAATALDLFNSVKRGIFLMSLSLVVHVLTAATAWCIARAVTVPFEFLHALLLVPPVALIATIPISIAGWGVRESALMLAFGYAGLSRDDGLIVSILFGAAYFVLGIVGGAAWLIGGRSMPLEALRHGEPPPESQPAQDRRYSSSKRTISSSPR
jgi:uncharacterized membrane protein YbhN (UPF0104 family)